MLIQTVRECSRYAEIRNCDFAANRFQAAVSCSTGLWTHQKGGFFHDGRFATLLDVVNHYDEHFKLKLSDANKNDLVEYLKGL